MISLDPLFNIGLFTLFTYALEWTIRAFALFIVPRNRKPSAAMTWLLLIFLFPLPGFIIYLILGNSKLPRARRNALLYLNEGLKQSTARFRRTYKTLGNAGSRVHKHFRPIVKLSEHLTHLPAIDGNKIEVLTDYKAIIAAAVTDIDNARYYVHLEYFIFTLDETTEPLVAALARATARGVDTRILYDWLGSIRQRGFLRLRRRLKKDGVISQPLLPLRLPGRGYVRPDLRNHRKIIVIDGNLGYTGSQNLIRRTYHKRKHIVYDDLVIRVHGPVVFELSALFISDWFIETGMMLTQRELGTDLSKPKRFGTTISQVLPSGPGYDDENNLKIFTGLIHAAEKSITIASPYFVPDESLLNAITSAAGRGVKVTILNSATADQFLVAHAQRSYYESLLKAGVKLFLYPKPKFLHAKYMIIDDYVSVVGSSNFDIRSFQLDMEVMLISYDKSVARQLLKASRSYLKISSPLKLETWQKRPQYLILFDNIARLTSSLQ